MAEESTVIPDNNSHGILLVDKPVGPTSHDVVDQVRHAFGCKAGHAGTLDPFATGLLIVMVGKATREQNALMSLTKDYDATARFGVRSDTGDPEGEMEASGAETTREEVLGTLPDFTGAIEQSVPLFSAVKLGGERLYKKARRGERVETPRRTVEVERIELRSFGDQRAELAVRCSKGTYIRQLVADLGEAVGAGAYCEQLRRTRIGPLNVEDAATREQMSAASSLAELSAWRPMRIRFDDLELSP